MKLAIVYSRANSGIEAPLVTVETHLSGGLPRFNIVGLPETAVQESKDRVRSALLNSGFEFPTRRITVNLGPADLPKEGGRFDLPIAIGILAASGQIPKNKLSDYEFTGELALSGELRSVRGILPMAIGAQKNGRFLVVPEVNAQEASLVQQVEVYAANHLLAVCAHLTGKNRLPIASFPIFISKNAESSFDLADVKGQPYAKRALEIAAAGRHNLLLIGPPGTGKTMLASRISSILPPLNDKESLEVAAIASISMDGFDYHQWRERPFRSPHHTSSSAALVGGGRPPRPGEISLAHRGILFLDEFPEFNRRALESLREPLESGKISISRAAFQIHFPAQFQLIAAMNPCPCGLAGSTIENCRCTQEQIERYHGKISGPLLDRIDMQVEVPNIMPEILSTTATDISEKSLLIKERVILSRDYQFARQQKYNSELTTEELSRYCRLPPDAQQLLNKMVNRFNFSARVYHRILKVARTIADSERQDNILASHLGEALSYRCLDKAKWNIHK